MSRALLGLGVLAALSICLSALPWPGRLPLCALALGYGAWLARREARRPRCWVQLDEAGSGMALVFAEGAQRLSGRQVHLRGPLARISGRGSDGRRRHLTWWPDTLPAAARRSLRLADGKSVEESAPALATMPG